LRLHLRLRLALLATAPHDLGPRNDHPRTWAFTVGCHRLIRSIGSAAGVAGRPITGARRRWTVVLCRALGMHRPIDMHRPFSGTIGRTLVRAVARALHALFRRTVRSPLGRALGCRPLERSLDGDRRRPFRRALDRASRATGRRYSCSLGMVGTGRLLDAISLWLSLRALYSLHTFSTLASLGLPFIRR
jgi:hypothetical protein